MKRSEGRTLVVPLMALAVATGFASFGPAVRADDGRDGYAVGERSSQPIAPEAETANTGPVRLARISYVSGNVTWRPDDSASWSRGSVNVPLRQGAQIWVTDAGRAEVQFDDGSLLRLGTNAVATLQTLYSDADGEFTEVKLSEGLASLRLKTDHSIFQVDTPLVSVKAAGPAKIRIGSGDNVEVGVRSGRVTVEGAQGTVTMQKGDYLDLLSSNAAYDVRALPRGDSWEDWNDDRDARLDEAARSYEEHRLPSNIALVATDLDSNGSWRDDPTYGTVWCPRVSSSDWRPYRDGHWTWVDPFGWTWVSDESWGWAPYHYGTWVHAGYGWGWVPGPVHQYWCPAVVNFTECDGQVAWCPLAPAEVRYPAALSIGFHSGIWSTYFSIAQCAVYYPYGETYCRPRVFENRYVNHVTYINNVTNNYNYNGARPNAFDRYQRTGEGFAANHNTYSERGFVPVNARNSFGVTAVDRTAFGGSGRYQPVTAGAASLFQRGRTVGAPLAGQAPSGGPSGVKPTETSFTPSRTFITAPLPVHTALARPVYRAPLQQNIERASPPVRAVNRTPADPFTTPRGRANPDTTGVPAGRSSVVPGDTPSSSRTGTPGRRIDGSPRGSNTNPADPYSIPDRTPNPARRDRYGDSTTGGTPDRTAVQRARDSVGYTGRARDNTAATGNSHSDSTTRPQGPSAPAYPERYPGSDARSRTFSPTGSRTPDEGRVRNAAPGAPAGPGRAADPAVPPVTRPNSERTNTPSNPYRPYAGSGASGRSSDEDPARSHRSPAPSEPNRYPVSASTSRPTPDPRRDTPPARSSDTSRRDSSSRSGDADKTDKSDKSKGSSDSRESGSGASSNRGRSR